MKKYKIVDTYVNINNPDNIYPIMEESPDGKWEKDEIAEKLIDAYYKLEQKFIYQIDTQAYKEMTCIINEALGNLRDVFEDAIKKVKNEE